MGGQPDTTTKAVVAITDGGWGFCTGSLIAPNLVLTARHCVADIQGEDPDGGIDCSTTSFGPVLPYGSMFVSIEDDITGGASSPGLLFATQAVRVPSASGVCANDLALIILQGSGIPSTTAPPFEPRLDSPPQMGGLFSAVGYGIQDPGDGNANTYGERRRYDNASVFCAGADCGSPLVGTTEWAGDAPTCSGDSGGPAIDEDNRVMGALSRGDDACSFAIYTGTHGFSDFIKAGAVEAATLGGIAPPTWAQDTPEPAPDAGVPVQDAGNPEPDAGTDSGAGPDGGEPDADPDEDAGPRRPPGPTVDPLGTACNGDCPGDYACYAESGEPPGICVPLCGGTRRDCPVGYECSSRLAACIPAKEEEDREVEGCSMSAGSKTSSASSLPLLLVLGLLVRRSRRRA